MLKIQAFWNITSCRLVVTDVSEKLAALIVKVVKITPSMAAEIYSEMSVITYQSTRRHMLGDLNLHHDRCEHLKSRISHSDTHIIRNKPILWVS